jgi:predicted HD superfamily hydrolase involved in NAD metabolism
MMDRILKEAIADEEKLKAIEKMAEKLKGSISGRRYSHTMNVMYCAVELAVRHNASALEAALAGLLHDCAKDIRGEEALRLADHYGIEVDEVSALQPDLLHGKIGAILAREQYLGGLMKDAPESEQSVLNAIRYHTTGYPEMTLLDSIIFIADFIEPERSFPGVEEIRRKAFEDLDTAVLMGMDSTVIYILERGRLLHPDTIFTRNWLIRKKHIKKLLDKTGIDNDKAGNKAEVKNENTKKEKAL